MEDFDDLLVTLKLIHISHPELGFYEILTAPFFDPTNLFHKDNQEIVDLLRDYYSLPSDPIENMVTKYYIFKLGSLSKDDFDNIQAMCRKLKYSTGTDSERLKILEDIFKEDCQ